MSCTKVIYDPRTDATPEAEIATLANVYKFVAFDCRAKKAAPDRRPEDEKVRSSNDSLATQNYTG